MSNQYTKLNPQPAYDDIYSSYIINNASIVGTLTSPELGKYTGFSTSNYIKPYMSLTQNCGSNPWKVQIKFNLNTIDKTNFLWGGNAGTYLPDIYVTSGNKFKIRLSSNGSSYDITDSTTGTFSVQANTDYWVRLEYTGSKYSLSYSTDGETFTEDISVTSSTHIENTSDISVIGVRGDLGDPIDGYIDLSDSYYELNGTKYNFGYKQLNQGIIIKEPSFTLQNATVTGTLTNNNGVYSGFGASNCLTSNIQIDLSKDFEFYIQVTVPNVNTIGTSMDAYQIIIGKDLYFQLCFRGFADKCIQKLGSNSGNGSSWQQGKDSGNLTYIPNQTYDIKVVKDDGTIYVYSKSVYNAEYTLDFSYSCTQTSSFYPNLGSYNNYGSQYLKTGSKINMAATKLVQDGTTTTFNSATSITIPQGMYEEKGIAKGHYIFDKEGNLIDCDNKVFITQNSSDLNGPYINTGLKANSSRTYEITAKLNWTYGVERDGALWGSRGPSYDNSSILWYNAYYGTYPSYSLTYYENSAVTATDQLYTFKISNDSLYVNDVLIANYTANITNNYNLLLGAYSEDGTVNQRTFYGEIVRYKVYDSSHNLIQDMIPVPTGMKIKDTTMPGNGMWDTVSKTFFGNQGNGQFLYGEFEKLKTIYSTANCSRQDRCTGSSFRESTILPSYNKLDIYIRMEGQLSGVQSMQLNTDAFTFFGDHRSSQSGHFAFWTSSGTYSNYGFSESRSVRWLHLVSEGGTTTAYMNLDEAYSLDNISSGWTTLCSVSTQPSVGSTIGVTCNTNSEVVFQQFIILNDGNTLFDLQTSDLSTCTIGDGTVIGEILV